MGRGASIIAILVACLAAWSAPADADCVSDCQAATYCDSAMHESGECSSRLNACYATECSRTRYGAIAYGVESGAFGWSNDLYDAPAAEQQALAHCREHGDDCAVVVDFWNTCAAVAAAGNRIVDYGLGDTRGQAEGSALAACAKDGGVDCAVQAWSCAQN